MAFGEDIEDGAEAGVAGFKQDKEVVDQVGCLTMKRGIVFAQGCDDDLGCLFAQLLGALRDAGVE